MLLGEITYKMGLKHRLALPKKFRQELGEVIILTRGYEGCLVGVSLSQWQHLANDIEQGSFLDINARESARFLFGGAHEVGLDAQGRFIVPPALYEYADLHDEVVFVGLGNWLEIWDSAAWQQQLQRLSGQGAIIAQRLVNRGDSQ